MANKIIREDGFEQIIDGEGFTLESQEVFKLKCCSCGLVHKMVLVSEDDNPIGVAMERIGEPPSSPTEHIKE